MHVLDYSLQNVCQLHDTNLSQGFLSTPNYPHGISSNLNCPCALSASIGHAIVLEIVEFRLPSCAEAGLFFWLGDDFQTKCSIQDPITLVGNPEQNVTLRFYTVANVRHGGFLIKYSVLPASDSATVRLQCSPGLDVSQPSLPTHVATHRPVFPRENPVDHTDRRGLSIGQSTHASDLAKRIPPVFSAVDVHKVHEVMSIFPLDR